jgi:hypothetical protein
MFFYVGECAFPPAHPSVDTGLDFPRCPGGGRVPGSRDGLQAPSSFMIQVSTKGERQGFEKGVTTGSRPTYVHAYACS